MARTFEILATPSGFDLDLYDDGKWCGAGSSDSSGRDWLHAHATA